MSCRRAACAVLPLVAVAVGISCLSAQQPARARSALANRIERITSRPEFRHALWGIEVYALDTRERLYAVNPDKLFVPGSTTKLLTEGHGARPARRGASISYAGL